MDLDEACLAQSAENWNARFDGVRTSEEQSYLTAGHQVRPGKVIANEKRDFSSHDRGSAALLSDQ